MLLVSLREDMIEKMVNECGVFSIHSAIGRYKYFQSEEISKRKEEHTARKGLNDMQEMSANGRRSSVKISKKELSYSISSFSLIVSQQLH